MTLDAIRDDFALLDDWEDRYRYVIELGRGLAPLPESERSEVNKVRGCASQVWLSTSREGLGADGSPVLRFVGDSDALIVKGLIAILLEVYSGRTVKEILDTDAMKTFDEMGLREHLTPQRSNGLASMVERIRRDAAAVNAAGSA